MVALAPGPAPSVVLAHDYAEIARWGRLVGRLDARESHVRGRPLGEDSHTAAFRRSALWLALDRPGRHVFYLAHAQSWAAWNASAAARATTAG